MKKITLISLLFIFLFSCKKKFPDYINKADGVYMRLLSFDEDEKGFTNKCYTSASLKITANNKLIYQQYKESIIAPEDERFKFLLHYLNEGDSAIFKISSDVLKKEFTTVFSGKIKSDYVDVSIKVHHYYSSKEYQENFKNVDGEMIEQVLLKKYLKDNNIGDDHFKKGIYIKKITKGKGRRIKKGKTITINYKGYFVNRLEFDNTYKETTFTFTYGTPGQVIKGLEIALKGMRKGEKSKIIIPSQLAFGEEGSSTQIVPPFTTVIYELEIINVK